MKTVVWVLVSPMLHALALVTALVCVTLGTILGRLTPQQLSAMPNASVAHPNSKNEAPALRQDSQQPTSSEPSSGAEHVVSKLVHELWSMAYASLPQGCEHRRHVCHTA